jgi:hypothetical protein
VQGWVAYAPLKLGPWPSKKRMRMFAVHLRPGCRGRYDTIDKTPTAREFKPVEVLDVVPVKGLVPVEVPRPNTPPGRYEMRPCTVCWTNVLPTRLSEVPRE